LSTTLPTFNAVSLNFETFFDLSGKFERLKSLENQQALPGFWADPEAARRSVQEIKILKNWLTPYDNLDHRLGGALEMAELLDSEPDEGLQAELGREADEIVRAAEAFELQAMLQGPEDARDALLTIHPGAGCTESQDWAEMLMRMYVRWAERHGFEVAVLDLLPGEEAGIKSVSIEIRGQYAYG
jgi:peptide chain release factor 2